MKNLTKKFKNLWTDESAQGATEYILLLIVVVALVMIFKDKIQQTVESKVGELQGKIESVQ